MRKDHCPEQHQSQVVRFVNNKEGLAHVGSPTQVTGTRGARHAAKSGQSGSMVESRDNRKVSDVSSRASGIRFGHAV